MKNYIAILFCAFTGFALHAQNIEWLKKSEAISGSNQSIKAVVTDSENNTYALGSFSQQFNFNDQQYTVISPGGGGQTDLFIAKFSPLGEPLFFKRFGGDWYDTPNDIAIDSNNNIYASVNLQFPTLFFEDTTFQNTQAEHCIVKFDSEGNFIQLINNSNNLFLSEGKLQIIDNSIYCISNVALTKFTLDGQTQFIKVLPHLLSNLSLAKNAESQLVFCGTGNSNYAFEGYSISGQGSKFTIACVFDTAGTVIRHIDFGLNNSFDEFGNACAIDNSGNVYVGAFITEGYFAEFANDTVYDPIFNSSFQTYLKFDNAGNPVWARNFIGTAQTPNSIILDGAGNLVCNGQYGSIYNFIGSFPLPANGFNGNGWIARLSPDNELLSAFGYGTSNSTDYSYEVAVDSENNIIAGGFIGAGANSIYGCINYPSTPGGFCLFKLNNSPPPVPTVTSSYTLQNSTVFFEAEVENADTYSWNFGDGSPAANQLFATHTYAQPGAYNACISAGNSCGTSSSCSTIVLAGLARIEPSVVANEGYYRLNLFGGLSFISGSFQLVQGGSVIATDTLFFINNGQIQGHFNFDGIPTGLYDVIFNSGSFSDTLFGALTVELPDGVRPDITINSPGRTLNNRFTGHSVQVSNNSNQPSAGFGVGVSIGGGSAQAVLLSPVTPSAGSGAATQNLGGQHFFPIPNPANPSETILVGYFVLGYLSPGETQTINFRIKPEELGAFELTCSGFQLPVVEPLPLPEGFGFTTLTQCFQCGLDALPNAPGDNCDAGIERLGDVISNTIISTANQILSDLNLAIIESQVDCGNAPVSNPGFAQMVETTVTFTNGLYGTSPQIISSNADLVGDLSNCQLVSQGQPDCESQGTCYGTFQSVASLDPNMKTGPVGYNDLNCVNGNTPMDYIIEFENVDTASAATSDVYLFDTLDLSKFDLSTFRFLEFGFDEQVVDVSSQNTNFTQELDLRPAKNTILRISGSLDETSGIARWEFISLDADTREPNTSVDDGFLNPNLDGTEGRGYVSFQVKPIADLDNGVSIENSASIVFDASQAIITPVFLNTIDKQAPESNVFEITDFINDSTFVVRWLANDDAAGIAETELYMSINDTATYRICDGMVNDTLVYTGRIGDTYAFYTVATDWVGNREETPSAPDATITPSISTSIQQQKGSELTVFPNPFAEALTLSSTNALSTSFQIIDMLGKTVYTGTIAGKTLSLNLGQFDAGTYFLHIMQGNKPEVIRVVKQ